MGGLWWVLLFTTTWLANVSKIWWVPHFPSIALAEIQFAISNSASTKLRKLRKQLLGADWNAAQIWKRPSAKSEKLPQHFYSNSIISKKVFQRHTAAGVLIMFNYVYSIDTQNRMAIINYFPITVLVKSASGNVDFISGGSCSVHAQRQWVLGLLYMFIPCCHCIGLVNGVVYICIHMKCRCGWYMHKRLICHLITMDNIWVYNSYIYFVVSDFCQNIITWPCTIFWQKSSPL